MINRMGLSWGTNLVKYMLFGVNLVFVITGIIILSVGVSVKAYYNDYATFLDTKYFSTPNLLIAIGSIIFIVSFFGCCGAVKENFCMTVTFSTLLILVFILELAAGIAGYALRDTTTDFLTDKLTESLDSYNVSGDGEVTVMWDLIQKEFACCGVTKASDWTTANSTGNLIPISCCSPANGAVGAINCTLSADESEPEEGTETATTVPSTVNTVTPYTQGCVDAFGDLIKSHAVTLGAVGIAFAFIQLAGIAFSCLLAKKLREQQLYS